MALTTTSPEFRPTRMRIVMPCPGRTTSAYRFTTPQTYTPSHLAEKICTWKVWRSVVRGDRPPIFALSRTPIMIRRVGCYEEIGAGFRQRRTPSPWLGTARVPVGVA